MARSAAAGQSLMDYYVQVSVYDEEVKQGLKRIEDEVKTSTQRINNSGSFGQIGEKMMKGFSPTSIAKTVGLFHVASMAWTGIGAAIYEATTYGSSWKDSMDAGLAAVLGVKSAVQTAREETAAWKEEGKRVAAVFEEIRSGMKAQRGIGAGMSEGTLEDGSTGIVDSFRNRFKNEGNDTLRQKYDAAKQQLWDAEDKMAKAKQQVREGKLSPEDKAYKAAEEHLRQVAMDTHDVMIQLQQAVDYQALEKDRQERAATDERERQAAIKHAEDAMKEWERLNAQEEQLQQNIQSQEDAWVKARFANLYQDKLDKAAEEPKQETMGLEDFGRRLLTMGNPDVKKQIEIAEKQRQNLEKIEKGIDDLNKAEKGQAAMFTA